MLTFVVAVYVRPIAVMLSAWTHHHVHIGWAMVPRVIPVVSFWCEAKQTFAPQQAADGTWNEGKVSVVTSSSGAALEDPRGMPRKVSHQRQIFVVAETGFVSSRC